MNAAIAAILWLPSAGRPARDEEGMAQRSEPSDLNKCVDIQLILLRLMANGRSVSQQISASAKRQLAALGALGPLAARFS